MERNDVLKKITGKAKEREEEERSQAENNPLFKMIDDKLKIPKIQKLALYAKLSNVVNRGGQLPSEIGNYLGTVAGGASIYSLVTNMKKNVVDNKKATSDFISANNTMRYARTDGVTEAKASVGRSAKNLSTLALPWMGMNAMNMFSPGLVSPAVKNGLGNVALPGLGATNMLGGINAVGSGIGAGAGGILSGAGAMLKGTSLASLAPMLGSAGTGLTVASGGALAPILGTMALLGMTKGIGSIRDNWIKGSSINKFKNSSSSSMVDVQHPRLDPLADTMKNSFNSRVMMLLSEGQMTPAEALQAQIMSSILASTFPIADILYELRLRNETKDALSGNKLQNNLFDTLSPTGISDRGELNQYKSDAQLSSIQKLLLGVENYTSGISDLINSPFKTFTRDSTTAGFWERNDKTKLIDPNAPEKAVAETFNISLSAVGLLHKDYNEVMSVGKDYNGKVLAIMGANYEMNRLIAQKAVEGGNKEGKSLYGFLKEQQTKQQEQLDEMNNTFIQNFIRPMDEFISTIPILKTITPAIHLGVNTTKALMKPISGMSENFADSFMEQRKQGDSLLKSISGGILGMGKTPVLNMFKEAQEWGIEKFGNEVLNNEQLLRERVGLLKLDNQELAYSYLGQYFADDMQTVVEHLHVINESTAWLAKVQGINGRTQHNKSVINEFTGERQTIGNYNKYLLNAQDKLVDELNYDNIQSFGDVVLSKVLGVNAETITNSFAEKDYIQDMLADNYKQYNTTLANDFSSDLIGVGEMFTESKEPMQLLRESISILDDSINDLNTNITVIPSLPFMSNGTEETKDKTIDPSVAIDSKDNSSELVGLRRDKKIKEETFGMTTKTYDLDIERNDLLKELKLYLMHSQGRITPEMLKQIQENGGDTNVVGGGFGGFGDGPNRNKKRKPKINGKAGKIQRFMNKARELLSKGGKGALGKVLNLVKTLGPRLAPMIMSGPLGIAIATVSVGSMLYSVFEDEIHSILKPLTNSKLWKDLSSNIDKFTEGIKTSMKPILDLVGVTDAQNVWDRTSKEGKARRKKEIEEGILKREEKKKIETDKLRSIPQNYINDVMALMAEEDMSFADAHKKVLPKGKTPSGPEFLNVLSGNLNEGEFNMYRDNKELFRKMFYVNQNDEMRKALATFQAFELDDIMINQEDFKDNDKTSVFLEYISSVKDVTKLGNMKKLLSYNDITKDEETIFKFMTEVQKNILQNKDSDPIKILEKIVEEQKDTNENLKEELKNLTSSLKNLDTTQAQKMTVAAIAKGVEANQIIVDGMNQIKNGLLANINKPIQLNEKHSYIALEEEKDYKNYFGHVEEIQAV